MSNSEKEKEGIGEPDMDSWSKAGPSGRHKETVKVANPQGKPKNTEGKAKLKKPHEVCGNKGTIRCAIC